MDTTVKLAFAGIGYINKIHALVAKQYMKFIDEAHRTAKPGKVIER